MANEITFKGLIDDQLDIKSNNNIIHFKNYLTEKKVGLLEIIKDDKDHLIIAPTGSGKTSVIKEIGLESEYLILIAVPLVMIADQQHKNDSSNLVGLIHGGYKDSTGKQIDSTTDDEISSYFRKENRKKVIFCVYDSVKRFSEKAAGMCKHFTLVIDEAHHLTTSVNFRTVAINKLLNARSSFRKTIYLTGTPEGTIVEKIDKACIHHFQKKRTKKQTLNILKSKKPLYQLFNHLIENCSENTKVVILIDNRMTILELAEVLRIHFGKDSVMILSSIDKDSEEARYVIEKKKLADHIKFLLTTRVMSDGIDVEDENIKSIYIYAIGDTILKRQFIGRFRKHGINIYEFVESKYTLKKINSYNALVKEYSNLLLSNPEKLVTNDYRYRQEAKDAFINNRTKNPNLGDYISANFALDVINRENIYPSESNTQAYYKKFTNFDIDFSNYEARNPDYSLKEFEELLDRDYSAIPENLEWYKENLSKIVAYKLSNSGFPMSHDFRNADEFCIDYDLDKDSFILSNPLFLKKNYTTIVEGKRKAGKKAKVKTRFESIYSKIEEYIKYGFKLPLIKVILEYGLREEFSKFTEFINCLETYIYCKYYTQLENYFPDLVRFLPKLEAVQRFDNYLRSGKQIIKKELDANIHEIVGHVINTYEIDSCYEFEADEGDTGIVKSVSSKYWKDFFKQFGLTIEQDVFVNGKHKYSIMGTEEAVFGSGAERMILLRIKKNLENKLIKEPNNEDVKSYIEKFGSI